MKLSQKHPNLFIFLFNITIVPIRFVTFWIRFLLRKIGIHNKKNNYSKLKQFKNKHRGERCFVVGTGPSLTMDDLDKIKNETSFSVNSIVLSFPNTKWRPTYYAIQDKTGYEKLEKALAIRKHEIPNFFIGISDKSLTPIANTIEYVPFPLNLLDHGKIGTKHLNRFSGNAFNVVYDGHSITYSCLQLAVFMGFKEIVLLGVDCDYSQKVNHVIAYNSQSDNNAAFLMRESFKCARKYADKKGIRILNATRNAKLDVFERIDLDLLLYGVEK